MRTTNFATKFGDSDCKGITILEIVTYLDDVRLLDENQFPD